MTYRRLWLAIAVAGFLGAGPILLQGEEGKPLAAERPTPPASVAADWGVLLPSGPGKEYATALCNGCHTVGVPMLRNWSRTGWESFLEGMNAAREVSEICACIGGPLNREEIEILSSYLGEALGPQNPIQQLPLNVNTATPKSLMLLPGLDQSDVQELLDQRARSPFTSKAEIEKLLGRGKFHKIEQFIDVRDSNFRSDSFLLM